MKKIKNILYTCLLSAALFSCADDDMPAGSLQVKEGIPVTLTLSYQMLDNIEIKSRAAEDGETGSNETTATNKPDDYGLQIFIFNKDGVLTGYESLTENEFHYDEEDAKSVSIETLTGKSYIYAVANYNSNRYKVNGLTVTGQKPSITREKFLELTFERDKGELGIPHGETKILMSGRYQDETDDKRNVDDDGSCTIALGTDGNAVICNSTGTIDDTPIIYLKRVVSKVTFNINLTEGAPNSVEFKPFSYEIHNIAQSGNLLGYLPNEIQGKTTTLIEEDYVYDTKFSTQSPNSFTMYIPENLQKVKDGKNCGSWHDRETNSYDKNGNKTFTNAPDNGTYVVIKGTYHDKNSKLLANVEYTIHLGDFGGTEEKETNYNNFDNERNCEYTYNVTVINVNEIIVEAHKKEDGDPEYPGTEGLVINYSGKAYTVDSHYEAVIMRIYKSANNEYKFMVETPWNGMSELVSTSDTDYGLKLANLDVNWLSFALVSDVTTAVESSSTQHYPDNDYKNALTGMSYDETNPKGGNVPFLAYTYTKNNNTDNLKSFQDFFSYLTDTNNWINNETYKDVICFIDEYYYSDKQYAIDIAKENSEGTKTSKSWDKYTNTTPRSFYLIKTVAVSPDGHSTYMEATHSISQHSIQTFYNPSKASEIMAYGCEYINNEESFIDDSDVPQTTPDDYSSNKTEGYDYWDGRQNTIKDIDDFKDATTKWAKILVNDKNVSQPNGQTFLRWAFVDRNRDLNRDGKIDQDEIRWYTPTIPQYCGFWMGEDAIATEARLYNEEITNEKFENKNYGNFLPKYRRHYYTSTPGSRTFWAEEGLAYGGMEFEKEYPHHLRCIRNLGNEADKTGTTKAPDMYYSRTGLKFYLSNMDSKTLRTGSLLTTELNQHGERLRKNDASNNNLPREIFELAMYREGQTSDGQGNITRFCIQKITNADVWYGTYPNYNTKHEYNGPDIKLTYQQDNDNIMAGSWRIPNQREFALICIESMRMEMEMEKKDNDLPTKLQEYPACLLANIFKDNTKETNMTEDSTPSEASSFNKANRHIRDACRTLCSNAEYRQGFNVYRVENSDTHPLILSMISGLSDQTELYQIRPVRDIAK